MRVDKRIIQDICMKPFYLELTKEDFELMKQDDKTKDKAIDFRDKICCGDTDINVIEFIEKRRYQSELHDVFNSLGGFVLIKHNKLRVLIGDERLSQEDKSKILLLATYMKRDNILRFDNNIKVKLKHIPELLGVSRQATHTFLTKVKELGIIISNEDGSFSMSEDLFCKEKQDNNTNETCEFEYSKVFTDTYRKLYESIDKRKIKCLGVLFSVLGYINLHYNVLVRNKDSILEINYNNIDTMSYDEMYALCNNKSNVEKSTKIRFKYGLDGIKLENGENLFTFKKHYGKELIFINPNVVYSSPDVNTWLSTLEIIYEDENFNRISSLSNYLRGQIVPWVNKMRNKYNNKCAITGVADDSNVVHHIHAFSLIVEEALRILNQTVYSNINEYTEVELGRISDLIIKLHDENIDGVVIRKDIHVAFHKKYGYGYNTLEQWEEFKDSYDASRVSIIQ